MEMLENGSVSEKEPSAPLSDSNGFYAKNMEFNGNDRIQRPMGHYRKKYRILSSCQL